MTLRCKPGDLCVIVGGAIPENAGRYVFVREPGAFGPGWWYCEAASAIYSRQGQNAPTLKPPGFMGEIRDCCLRPIRDGEGTDETIRWAGLPREIAHA